MYCRFCGKQIPDHAKFCPECGADLAPAPSAAPPENTLSVPAAPVVPVEPAMPPQGTPYYEGNAEMVYHVFPALQPLDIVMGVVCLALAVYAVVVQRALAKFRAKGPMMYYLMYIVNTAATVLYLLIGSIIIGQSVFTAEVAGSIIGSLVMLFVNIPYFNNRKHLFVNP